MAQAQRPPQYFPLTYAQMFGYIFGIVYLAVGVAGYASTNHIGFTAAVGGRELQLFSVNPLHNIAHLIIGSLLMISAFAGPLVAKGVATIVGTLYLILAVVGPFLTLAPSSNILALNFADDVLHALTAVTALGTVFVLSRFDNYARA